MRSDQRGNSHPSRSSPNRLRSGIARFAFLLLLLVTLLHAGCNSCGSSSLDYDSEPLLASIRQDQRQGIAQQANLGNLNELPLYTIDISVDLGLLSWSGTEEIIFTNRTNQPLSEIILRLYPNSRQLNVQGSRNLVVSNVRVDGAAVETVEQSPTALRIPLPNELAAGERTQVNMDIRGSIPRYSDADTLPLLQGLGALLDLLSGGEAQGADYGIYGFSAGILNMGLWYARLADWTPQGWDASDPSVIGDISAIDLGNYRVSVTLPSDTAIVSTGAIEEEETEEGQTRRTFIAAAVRSFAWQASRNYLSQENPVGDVIIRTTYDREHSQVGVRVGEIAASVLEVYERMFGTYPYTELDVVEGPLRGGAGGVEWPGLVTIGRMLYEDPSAVTSGLTGPFGSGNPSDEYWSETLEFVVAHEVAHQYWNAVVGSDSRAHPFVDEALAQFSAGASFGERYNAQREEQVLNRQARLNYHLMRLMGGSDGPVDRPVDQFANVLEFAGIVYGKGPFYYRALRRDLGEGAFWQGLRTYYQRFRFRTAAPDDLPRVMAEVSSNQGVVNTLTQRWLSEPHGDEDLGQATLSSLLEPIFGSDAAAFIRVLEGILDGGDGSSGSGGLNPGQIIEDMMRGLGGDGLRGLLEGLFGGGQPSQPSQPLPPPPPPSPGPNSNQQGTPPGTPSSSLTQT